MFSKRAFSEIPFVPPAFQMVSLLENPSTASMINVVTCIGFPFNKISIISTGIITCYGINYPDSVQRALSNSFHPGINSLLNERIRFREGSAFLQIGSGWQQNSFKLISKHSSSVQRAPSNSFHPVINSLLNERIRLREDSAFLQIGNGWQQNISKLISKHSNKPLDGVELLKN
ncbi:hypothetical protein CDAR_232111 [Caerostris darwini]|uniref:Uncharacterized protein n=1 Tax=Caerostris darwini TaxID=1538125 RepID=A0AAV4RLJ9_9ARAC|nr:hypothetical protein CDAR_232111 [Caerostris darwini]